MVRGSIFKALAFGVALAEQVAGLLVLQAQAVTADVVASVQAVAEAVLE